MHVHSKCELIEPTKGQRVLWLYRNDPILEGGSTRVLCHSTRWNRSITSGPQPEASASVDSGRICLALDNVSAAHNADHVARRACHQRLFSPADMTQVVG